MSMDCLLSLGEDRPELQEFKKGHIAGIILW